MKTVTVNYGPFALISTTVQLNNVSESDILTAALSRDAARIACGHTSGVTVSDGKTSYRITRSGARRINS